MTAREPFAARCRGSAAERARWYRALASAVCATRSPCGAVFESDDRAPVPVVTVRPRSLVETVRASPGARTTGLDRVAGPEAPRPPAGWVDRIRQLVPLRPAGELPSSGGGVGREPPELALLVGADGWVGFQTHWVRGSRGELWAARRVRIAARDTATLEARLEPIASALALDWAAAIDGPVTTWPARVGAAGDWRRGTIRTVPSEAWIVRPLSAAERTAEPAGATSASDGADPEGHAVVFGASGAGKTTYLARRAAEHAERGGSVVVVDLHGDLAPAVLARLSPGVRRRSVALDASDRPVPGIAALEVGSEHAERAAAHLVAGLKRLSPDGTDLYWGFRLERIFDTFVRLVLETGGSLVDLYGLLTDADRRDAARLATRRPEVARFLDELAPVVRRSPDFLWSAATRLSKVVLVPALAELLAPPDGGLEVEALVEEARPLLVRLPFATLGPEAAAFAGTLVLGRIYLGLAARRTEAPSRRSTLVVLDEVQGFAPRLVSELLSESRKFGLRVLVATQYPDRLAPEARSAIAGAPTEFVAFRVPRVLARTVGGWLGLPPDDAERVLAGLPVGHGVRLGPETVGPRSFAWEAAGTSPDAGAWSAAVFATRAEFVLPDGPGADTTEDDRATERLLLAVLAAEESGAPLAAGSVVDAARRLPGVTPAADELAHRWLTLERRGYVEPTGDGLRLTGSGERRLGLRRPTGATRESDAHRALLVATFRLFARRGYRLEIVRQGRYDTTLPDARLAQIPERAGPTPGELAREIERLRTGWAWRFFHGRDVHVEVEVSGALRPERIRRGWAKAEARGAFALFVVGDADRARRVRATLRSLRLAPDRAQVWTLSTGLDAGPSSPRRPNS